MQDDSLKPHPIQALHIAPRELRIKTHVPPDLSVEYDEEADLNLEIGHSDYNAETKRIQISTTASLGTEEPEINEEGDVKGIPFYLFVEVVGIFEVGEKFPADRIYEWANSNAVFILYPYLREHVFALTARAGFRPMLMQLLEVPLFTLAKEPSSAPAMQPSAEAKPDPSQDRA